ncbi:hypothetical protein BSKO_13932 [Bryopsis sp. KO-2023]|nr:hypothetical protein BSKO_13932 [Bryopsis sp. KO-2023]
MMARPPEVSGSQASDESSRLWEEEEERKALGRVVLAFRTYSSEAEHEVRRWDSNYSGLSDRHRALLIRQPRKYQTARQCSQVNQLFFNAMLAAFDPKLNPNQPVEYLRGASDAGDEAESAIGDRRPSTADVDKVRYVLKNLVRDWSEEGANERKMTYGRILDEMKNLFRDWPDDRGPPSILVPGSGLARLCVEIAGLGFETQGNEFSYFMLLPSSFMLNHSIGAKMWTVHPWALTTTNQVTDEDQLRGVQIPDRDPAEIVAGPGLLSMVAGDFTEVYRRPEYLSSFDCVVTSFFIDTAHNVLDYLDVISDVLKMGGFWINLGPLLYHWADHSASEDASIEISLADIERIAAIQGFRCLRKEMIAAPYLANPRSMYQTVYRAAFWTMVKEPPPPPAPPTSPTPPQGLAPIQEDD